ncbi:nuclease [Tistrella bauzanensis]|uniref:nuclease n=1 Tax=Tistrella TaxID=171436 RepID=UPI0031F6E769
MMRRSNAGFSHGGPSDGGPSDGAVRSNAASYRRGIVLGLTMAEIMLLLVFCLIIVASAVFARDARTIARMRDDLAEARVERERLLAEAQVMTQMLNTRPEIPADWQEVTRAAAAARQFAQTGLTVSEAARAAPYWQALAPAAEAGTSPAAMVGQLAEAAALDAARAAHDLTGMTPDEMASLAAEARAARTAAAERSGDGEHRWPPIINLSEAGGYSFAIGSARIAPDFQAMLQGDVVKQLLDLTSRYRVDVIEVIGHTDEQTMGRGVSNLDRTLLPVLQARAQPGQLQPGDNAGLGMARAASVVDILKADPRLKGLTILPLSAGQAIMPGDHLADGTSTGDVKERRRIEIRVRRSTAMEG